MPTYSRLTRDKGSPDFSGSRIIVFLSEFRSSFLSCLCTTLNHRFPSSMLIWPRLIALTEACEQDISLYPPLRLNVHFVWRERMRTNQKSRLVERLVPTAFANWLHTSQVTTYSIPKRLCPVLSYCKAQSSSRHAYNLVA